MSEWKRATENKVLQGIAVVPFELPKPHFAWIKKAVAKAKKDNIGNQPWLIGHINEEYQIKEIVPEVELYHTCPSYDESNVGSEVKYFTRVPCILS